MKKQNAVCLHSGILFRHKKERSSDTRYNMGEPRGCAKREKPDTGGQATFGVIPCIGNVQKGQIRGDESGLVVAGGCDWGPGSREQLLAGRRFPRGTVMIYSRWWGQLRSSASTLESTARTI